jgi:hypothetical protein
MSDDDNDLRHYGDHAAHQEHVCLGLLRTALASETDRAERAEADLSEAIDLVCGCAGQYLISNDDGTVTHAFESAGEALCAYLVDHGRMEEVGRGRFRITTTAKPVTGEE